MQNKMLHLLLMATIPSFCDAYMCKQWCFSPASSETVFCKFLCDDYLDTHLKYLDQTYLYQDLNARSQHEITTYKRLVMSLEELVRNLTSPSPAYPMLTNSSDVINTHPCSGLCFLTSEELNAYCSAVTNRTEDTGIIQHALLLTDLELATNKDYWFEYSFILCFLLWMSLTCVTC